MHRDLAARNVLVGNDKIVKISDFGLTRNMSEDLIYMGKTARNLPLKWMSPEAIIDEEYTMYSDVQVYFFNTLFLNVTLLFHFLFFISYSNKSQVFSYRTCLLFSLINLFNVMSFYFFLAGHMAL